MRCDNCFNYIDDKGEHQKDTKTNNAFCSNECEDNYFWQGVVRNKYDSRMVFIGGNAFYIKNEDTDSSFRGYNGKKWLIEFNDGRKIITTNLWDIGKIPDIFKDLVPDNAKWAKAMEDDKAEKTLKDALDYFERANCFVDIDFNIAYTTAVNNYKRRNEITRGYKYVLGEEYMRKINNKKRYDITDRIETNAKMIYLENYPVKSPRECVERAIEGLYEIDPNSQSEIADTLRVFDIELDEYINSIARNLLKNKSKLEKK